MPSYKFLVFTNPVAGMENEYQRWYNERHVPEVLAVPGIVAAQRFRLAFKGSGETAAFSHLAIYDIESEDQRETVKALFGRVGTDAMVMSPALDPKIGTSVWEEITPVVKASD